MIGSPNRPHFHTITPYLMTNDIDSVVDFLQQAFDATETYRTTGDAGGSHVELQIGDARLMLGGGSGTVDQPTQSAMFLYVEEVDAVYQSALDAGATSIIEPADGMFQEERGAGVRDPFGNDWYIGRFGPASEHE